jgi:pimeloyl-ACP methyl ester carboxylesterase
MWEDRAMRRGYADAGYGQVHYREAGSGRPLLLLHQTASSSAMYERAAPHLAGRFRVIAMDTPGFGMSDPHPEPSIEAYAAAVLALLDTLGVDRAAVVGFHTGAGIAIELAASHAERVEAAILIGVLPMKSDEDRQYWREQIVKPWQPDWHGEFLRKHLDQLQGYVPQDDPDLLLAELIPRLQAGGTYWHAYESVIQHRSWEQLQRIEVPTLFVNRGDEGRSRRRSGQQVRGDPRRRRHDHDAPGGVRARRGELPGLDAGVGAGPRRPHRVFARSAAAVGGDRPVVVDGAGRP